MAKEKLSKLKNTLPENKYITSRLNYMDNIKGILIFLVVFSHFLYNQTSGFNKILVDAIYLFHMPAFVFISGFFSKSNKSSEASTLSKLFIIYLFTNSFLLITTSLFTQNFTLVTPYYMTWYLLALIVWRITVRPLSKVKFILPILTIFALIVGYWNDVTNVMAIARIICFYPYFMAGYLLSESGLQKFRKISFNKKFLLGLLGSIITLSVIVFSMIIFKYNMNQLLMGTYQSNFDILVRISLFIISTLVIIMLLVFVTDKNIPLLSKCGKNSLGIYICHRIFALAFCRFFPNISSLGAFTISLTCTIAIMVAFGSNYFTKAFNLFFDIIYDAIFKVKKEDRVTKKDEKLGYKILASTTSFLLIFIIIILPFFTNDKFKIINTKNQNTNAEIIYNRMTNEKQLAFDNAFKITFSGDLILLEDAVKNAYNGTSYDFSNMFTYTKDLLSSADLTIGVFEGPMAGEDKGYSTSNYGDGKTLELNFPDSFAQTIKDVGYDVVTTANNHLLDKGTDGAYRTIDVLNDIGLSHIGSYKTPQMKQDNNVLVVEKDGLKFCILAYTYGTNNYTTEQLLNNYSHITSIIANPSSPYFNQTKQQVISDFNKAKQLNPDFIVVLPHWGAQFINSPDLMEQTWEQIFIENGADIILGDHTHSVQPTKIKNYNNKNIFISYCPGNYTNVYQEYNGDACILANVYIDKTSKTIIGGSITPMWGYSPINGNYSAVPIYDVLYNETVSNSMTINDLKRVLEVHTHITKVTFDNPIDINLLTKEYYFDKNGLLAKQSPTLEIDESLKDGTFYKAIKDYSKICFIGDSITAGTKNGGYGWYEPLLSYTTAEISRFAIGGATVQTLLDNANKITSTNAELYVIAIGTNDIRYRNSKICAMDSNSYIEKINLLTNEIKKANSNAKFIFIAPWTSIENDTNSMLPHTQKLAFMEEYSNALKNYCNSNHHTYIDPNAMISNQLKLYKCTDYLIDFIHPNTNKGILLYSKAVLSYKD